VRQVLPVERAGKGRFYLNIGHTGLDSDGFRDWVEKTDVRPVYFVHDLIPVTHPHFCRIGEALRHRGRMRTVLATAAGVIANSQATLGELADFADRNGLPFPPSLAAWLGSEPFSKPAKAGPGPPTFVALGTIEARKNHLLLLGIWLKLVEKLGEKAPRLLIIGQRGWEAEDVFGILDGEAALRGHVVEINRASDLEIASRLESSRALLFPSNAEGYGLPLVEALALGVPVIASDLPVFREIGQGVPLLLDPADESGWEAAILDYARPESAGRAAQLARMKTFQPPNWPAHFRAVDEWLQTLR
jgi:glycosyltransferase involved in cell wall biosynthesis